MNKDERAFFSILAVMAVCGWMYLFGAFCAASFDITHWSYFGRFLIATGVTIGCFISLGLIHAKE